MTHADRILELLGQKPGLDDDEISELLDIRPRQQVNQICHRLETKSLLHRKQGPRGKIVNVLVGQTEASSSSQENHRIREDDDGPQPSRCALWEQIRRLLRAFVARWHRNS